MAQSVNEILDRVVGDIGDSFQTSAREWPLVKRNLAITARNRNMLKICEMLDMPYTEMPLEKPEAA